MKHVSLIFTFTLLTILMGCSDSSSSKKKSTSSSSDALCSSGNNYYCKSGCPGYSPTYTSTICAGTTGGTTSGSTSGSTTGGSSSYSTLGDYNWGSRYGTPPKKPAIPTQSTAAFPGLSSGGYVNSGTVTMAFRQMYAPNLGMSDEFSKVVSSFFLNVDEAKGFFASDSILKLRFMPRPQPATTAGIPYCFGRSPGSGVDYGYTKLQFNVALKGVKPDGTLDSVFRDVKFVEAGINSYSAVIDYSRSSTRTMFPDGVVAVIYDVKANQGCTGATNYPANCTTWSEDSSSCWRMDIEALVDGN